MSKDFSVRLQYSYKFYYAKTYFSICQIILFSLNYKLSFDIIRDCQFIIIEMKQQ